MTPNRPSRTAQFVALGRAMVDAGLSHMALRTTAIDTAVREAVAAGATQLVILGAGYDGRAWRMSELAGVRVFEVDRPATQADKRARLDARLELPHGASTILRAAGVSIDR